MFYSDSDKYYKDRAKKWAGPVEYEAYNNRFHTASKYSTASLNRQQINAPLSFPSWGRKTQPLPEQTRTM